MPASRADALARIRPWVDRARSATGWDFSHLRTRALDAPRWDYAEAVVRAARGRHAVLDIDTGGGERTAAMRDALPAFAVATEAWPPNVPVAARRLRPLGVDVVSALGERGLLPFRADAFDLVIDRHGAFEPSDLARVVAPGGALVTQQVYAHHFQELRRRFPRKTVWPDHLAEYAGGLRALGWDVETTHQDVRVAYPSIGEVAYMIAVTPWDIPDFDLEHDLDALLAVEADCRTDDGVVLTECYYLLEATRPA